MSDLLSIVYIEGDILETFIRCLILFFSFDCLIGVANAIKSIKGVSS